MATTQPLTRSTASQVRTALAAPRIPLLRRGHVAIAAILFGAHLMSRGATAWHLMLVGVFAMVWYAVVRSTLLRESRSGPSWAIRAVGAAEATLFAGGAILALSAVVGLDVPVASTIIVCLEAGVLAFSWQMLIAGHRSLGEPLRCVVVGAPGVVEMIERERLAPGARPFELVGWLHDDIGEIEGNGTEAPLLGSIDDLERVAFGGGFDVVIVAIRSGRPALYARLLELTHLDIHVIELPAFFEREFGRVPLSELTPTWFLYTMHLYRRDETDMMKRATDIVLSVCGLVVGAPAIAIVALLVRLSSPGPVLFRQVRIGEHGHPFLMYKFRSMRQEPANDTTTWTGEDDPRITPIGRILRRFRMDELPQLVNVLRGQMTIVGPRPETPDYVRWLEQELPFYKPRHFAKPGITGWAQVCSGYAASMESTKEKLSYDLYYLRHRSWSLDLAIILRTFATIAKGSGAR